MRRSYSPEIEIKVIELYLGGYNVNEIHQQLGVSTGYISSVLEKFYEKLGKGEITATHEFNKILRKFGVSPKQAFEGTRIHTQLKKYGTTEEKFESFLKDVYRVSVEKNFEIVKVINAYKKISELQEKSDVSIEQIPFEYQNLLNKKLQIQKEVKELTEAKRKAKSELDEVLKEKKVTQDNLAEFVTIKNGLEKQDVDFKNLPKLANLFSRASEAGFDIDRIKKHLEKEYQYEVRKAQLEDKTQALSARETNLKAKIDDTSMKISTNEKLLKELQQLNRLGISADDLTEFGKKLYQVSKSQGVSIKQSFHKFVKNLGNYDKLLGYEPELEKIENEIQKKSQKLESIILRIENLQIKNKENLEAIKTIKELNQKGIVTQSILQWNNIFTISNLNPNEFEKELTQISNINKLKKSLEQNTSKLQKQVKGLESHKRWLESNIEELESKIKNVDQIVKNSLESFLNDARKKISEANLYSINTIKETNRQTADLLQERMSKFDRWVDQSMKESKKLGQLEWVSNFYEFLLGEKFDPSKDISIIIMILDRLNSGIVKQNLDSSFTRSHIKYLREDLEKILTGNV